MFRVMNYGRTHYMVHWAQAANEELAKRLPAADVTAENWWHWRTLCGKELIGHNVSDDYPVDCRTCVRSFEKGKRQAEELAARFG